MVIQPLNYTPKAIADLLKTIGGYDDLDQVGLRFIIDKLRKAQVFVLPDYGQLLDRSAPRPEVPETMFRPPFDVTVAEYPASAGGAQQGLYTTARSSRRIALAWEWGDDFPFPDILPGELGRGVGIASIAYLDDHRRWSVMPLIAHLPYEDAWRPLPAETSPFHESALAHGRTNKRTLAANHLRITPLPITPVAVHAMMQLVGEAQVFDHLSADITDEFNAYSDLCMALACRNVTIEKRSASKVLNRERLRNGKLAHFDAHVLHLRDHTMSGSGAAGGDRDRPRAHLRRGHIRRLAPDRITWVNQTMVRGHGFVDKVYAL